MRAVTAEAVARGAGGPDVRGTRGISQSGVKSAEVNPLCYAIEDQDGARSP
jgi:hypothetical protein